MSSVLMIPGGATGAPGATGAAGATGATGAAGGNAAATVVSAIASLPGVTDAQTALQTLGDRSIIVVHSDKIAAAPTGTAATDTANLIAFFGAVANGSTCILPPGQYNTNAPIPYPDASLRITGSGSRGTTIRAINASNLDVVLSPAMWLDSTTTPSSGAACHINNLVIDANRANQTSGLGHGLITMNQGSHLIDLYVKNTRGDGIRLASGTRAGFKTTSVSCNEIHVVQCDVRNFGGAGVHQAEFDSTIILTDGFVDDCIIDGSSSGLLGIQLDGGAGWLLDGNHIYAVQKDSIRADRVFGLRILNNYCEGFGIFATPGTYYAINCDTVGLINTGVLIIDNTEINAPITNPATGTVLFAIGVQAANGTTTCNVTITNTTTKGRSWTTATTGILVHNQDVNNVITLIESNNALNLWDVPILIGASGTYLANSQGNSGQQRTFPTTFSATPAISPGKVECANGTWIMTLSNNTSPTIPTAGRDGQTMTLEFFQDATGGRTVTWPGNVVNGPVINAAPGAYTRVTLKYRAATTTWYA